MDSDLNAEHSFDLLVVGGGAAGFFAAINAAIAAPAARVAILEATPRVLSKVKVSGGGRCNVTHHLYEPARLIKAYPRGEKELLGPLHRFGPEQTVQWFAARGVALKAEADGRMFPVTDSSQTVIDALQKARADAGVALLTKAWVQTVTRDDAGFQLALKDGRRFTGRCLMLATGSVPAGYELIKQLGHTLVEPVPSLFTFEIKHPLLEDMAGQSFARIRATLSVDGHNRSWVQEGPGLITHWGLSGPAILKLSAFAARELAASQYQARLVVQWSSEMSEAQAMAALQKAKEESPKKQIQNENPWPCNRRFWEKMCQLQGIDLTQSWAQVTKKAMQGLALAFTGSQFQVQGKGVFKEEFVTAGGVSRTEVDFRSMESRVCPGLYFAGEVVDVDGITGGFNFQNAWTGGWLAAQHFAARRVLEG